MSASDGAAPHRPSRLQLLFAGLVLVLSVGVRLRYMGGGSLFIDEAESSVNALTILEHGYPADHYLGLPIFENTLVEPWPESEEYEFRDSSYSSRGMAVYHGWLPLYAIALSQALHGVRPDVATNPPRVQHDEAEIRTRIRAARLPSVVFGGLFVLAMFLAGWALYGVDAGLCAMLIAASAQRCIWLAQQARYYSAALALSTLAALCAWRAYRRGRARDFALAGVVFVLLFHTSSLSFAILIGTSAVLLPGILRQPRAWRNLALCAGIVLAGTVPWMLWTGYLEHASRIPMARSMLDFPADYLLYLRDRPGRLIGGVVLLILYALLLAFRRRLPARLIEPVAAIRMPVLFLVWWILVAYVGFQVLVPAASCSMSRLSHVLLAAPILLVSLAAASGARVLWARRSVLLSVGAALAMLLATGNVWTWQRRNPYEAQAVFDVVDHLRGLEFAADTRLYALPYQHFCLTYYTGLPIQSIAPVRKSFLDRYPGEVVVLETTNRMPQPLWQWVQRFAREAGIQLTPAKAYDWVPMLHALMVRSEVEPLVRSFVPDLGPMPAWIAPVVQELCREAAKPGHGYFDYGADNPAIFKGYPSLTIDEFWPTFFYRFVGPEGRRGAKLNYAERMREAEAYLLPSTWIVLRCPARRDDPEANAR